MVRFVWSARSARASKKLGLWTMGKRECMYWRYSLRKKVIMSQGATSSIGELGVMRAVGRAVGSTARWKSADDVARAAPGGRMLPDALVTRGSMGSDGARSATRGVSGWPSSVGNVKRGESEGGSRSNETASGAVSTSPGSSVDWRERAAPSSVAGRASEGAVG
jgi:hypothetical protein